MAVVHGCAGVGSYGHGLTEQFIHMNGCCAAFALMSDEQRRRHGRRWVVPEHRPATQEYEVDIIGPDELARIVERLQVAAAEQPGREPAGTVAFVEVPREFDLAQFLALVELGRPYGLVVGWRRAASKEVTG